MARRARSNLAFTLIEVIGILAIIILLALTLAPALIRQMDRIASEKEEAHLADISEALESSAKRNRYIPARTNWATVVATELGQDLRDVTHTKRGVPRVLLVDPNLEIGVNGGGLPYQQTIAGSVVTSGGKVVAPKNPRFLLLSTIGPQPLPAEITNGLATAGQAVNNFNAIWNSAQNTVPAGPAWTGWTGRGDDLKIQRLNMSPLFLHIFLYNYDPVDSTQLGYFAVDRLATNQVPYNVTNNVGIDFFLLQGTVLTLLYEDGVSVDSEQVVNRNGTFVFERGVWRGSIFEGQRLTGLNIELTTDLFLASPWNKNAADGIRQYHLVDAMIDFMDAYEVWANLGTWPKGSDPSYQAVKNAQTEMSALAIDLMNSPIEGFCE